MIPIVGFQPFTTIDYPGALSCVMFTQGCPWRCRYCHNSELQPFKKAEVSGKWEELMNFLKSRQGLLDAVVVSGGEPTAHLQLPQALAQFKKMGFKVGLHTAGIYPERFAEALPFLDWVGFDFKAPLDQRYNRVTQIKNSHEAAAKSLDYLLASGVPAEFRCTWHPLLLKESDLEDMRGYLKGRGVTTPLVIQNFRTAGCVDSELTQSA